MTSRTTNTKTSSSSKMSSTTKIRPARLRLRPLPLLWALVAIVVAADDQLNQSRQQEVETFYIRKGANGTLPCLPVSPGDSQATMNKIEWFKEEKKLVEAEARHIIVWNTKNTIAFLPETGALLFRGVTNEDSGEYHCLLTKPLTGETEDGVVRFYVQGESLLPLDHLISYLFLVALRQVAEAMQIANAAAAG